MAEIRLKARGKINLTLDVLSRREDGYHEVAMVLQQIKLADEININIGKEGSTVRINSDNPRIPKGETNIAFRAARLMQKKYGINRTIDIYIEKNIPIAAGLGGGSTDAAAVIYGLNRLLRLNLGSEDMMALGTSLGADVPFCIMGGTALGRGIGDILTPIDCNVKLDFLLVKPDFTISTPWAYQNFSPKGIRERPDNGNMVKALERGDKKGIALGMINVLEGVSALKHPAILDIKDRMLRAGALGAVMTGSGPTVIGLFENDENIKAAAEHFRALYDEVIITKSFNVKEGD